MTYLYWIIVPAAGYLLGSLSFSIIISCLFLGRDIRKHGSGNAGATNMTRVFGWVAGVATLADVLKALAAMLIGRRLLGDAGVCLGGMAAMLGHCFPLFHHFKGGKGIATGAAIGFMIDWRVGVSIVAAFLIGALISKKVSIGSIAAAVTIIPATWIFAPRPSMIALSVFASVLAITRHRENIKRLRAGTEPDFRPGKAGK